MWNPTTTRCLLLCTPYSFQLHWRCQAMLPWIPLQLFSRIPTTKKKKKEKQISLICVLTIYACLSASLSASVGLCNFLFESLPACLHICLPTCFSTSASRHYFAQCWNGRQGENWGNNGSFFQSLLSFLLGPYMLQHNMILFINHMDCFMFPLFNFFHPPPASLSPLPAPSCTPSLQAGRKAGSGSLSHCQS